MMSGEFVSNNDSNEGSGYDNQTTELFRPTDLGQDQLNETPLDQQHAYAQMIYQQQQQQPQTQEDLDNQEQLEDEARQAETRRQQLMQQFQANQEGGEGFSINDPPAPQVY
jgi:hypothetical protein